MTASAPVAGSLLAFLLVSGIFRGLDTLLGDLLTPISVGCGPYLVSISSSLKISKVSLFFI
jgi:hypothetical protein